MEKQDQSNVPAEPQELTEDQLKIVAGGDKKTTSPPALSEFVITRRDDKATPL